MEYDKIKGKLKKEPQNGAINLIEQLLNENNCNYDSATFSTLRNLHNLRNTKQPIHGAEHKAIELLNKLGIDYPINYGDAGKKCLELFSKSISELADSIKNHSN